MTKQQNKLLSGAVLLAVALSLSACTSVKKEMGVDRNSPDEFLVIKRAPLTMPPDYTLRPPENAGDVNPAADSAGAAESALMGGPKTPKPAEASDKALLEKLGAPSADADIRKQIDEENGYISLKDRTVADKLIFWNDEAPSADDASASVVNPKAEAERIKKNKASGKPLNEGNVPVIEQNKGTLDKIF